MTPSQHNELESVCRSLCDWCRQGFIAIYDLQEHRWVHRYLGTMVPCEADALRDDPY